MAHLVPSEFPHESDTNVWAENTFFNACRDQLSDEWTVLYSQRFIGKRPSLGQRQGQGEVDFVLLHKTFGVIVVEVKGGQIDMIDGQWFSENKEGRHKIKNPFVQAEEGAQAIFEVLKNIVNDVRTTNSTHHCVVFPAVSKKSISTISTYGPRQIIILREDLKELTSKIEQVAVHWDQKPRWNDADFKKIRSGLLPSTKTPGVSYVQYVNILKELDLLTESQIRTIRQITNNPGTTVITGGAGTGKTVLGMYRAQQLALEGRDVLFLCANGSLAQHLRNEVENTGKDLPQNLTVDAMSAYLSTIGRAGTRGPEFEKRKQELPSRDDRYLDAVQRLNLEATIDCLIVDEAQDITKDELSLVELLVRPAERGGSIIILGDPNQQLALRRSESALGQIDSSECLLLDVNCRNTYEIAQIAHSFTQQLISTLETVSGIKVRKSKIRDEVKNQIESEIATIRDEYDPEQIVVLTLNGVSDFGLQGTNFLDGRRVEMQSQIKGRSKSDGILVYSAKAFQGREADAVIVVLNEKSLLRTFPFHRFCNEIKKNKRIASRRQALDDLHRVEKAFDKFCGTSVQKQIDQYQKDLDETDSTISENKRSFLVREFKRAREMEFDPRFTDPLLKRAWTERQKQSLKVALYSMMTRGRVILSVVGDSHSLKYIESELNSSDVTLDALLQEISDN